MTDGTTVPGLSFLFSAVEEQYSFDLILIRLCYTTGITNVIIQLRKIPLYSPGRRKGYQRLQRNCCSVVATRNLIKLKSAENGAMWENVFLLGVTPQGHGACSRVPAGTRLRSSRLFVSTSTPPLKSLMGWTGICSLWAKSPARLWQKDMCREAPSHMKVSSSRGHVCGTTPATRFHFYFRGHEVHSIHTVPAASLDTRYPLALQ